LDIDADLLLQEYSSIDAFTQDINPLASCHRPPWNNAP
jgi:hypothetical protein